MPRCLTREELEKLIAMEIENSIDWEEKKILELLIENAKNWSDQLTGFSYFLSKIFEKKLKEGQTYEDLVVVLDKTYQLQESMWLEIQEFDQDFMNYILKSESGRDRSLSLEDQLIQSQEKLSRHEYR